MYIEVATCAVKKTWLVWPSFQMLKDDLKSARTVFQNLPVVFHKDLGVEWICISPENNMAIRV